MFCPKCGKETDDSGVFCNWCGSNITAEYIDATGIIFVFLLLGGFMIGFLLGMSV